MLALRLARHVERQSRLVLIGRRAEQQGLRHSSLGILDGEGAEGAVEGGGSASVMTLSDTSWKASMRCHVVNDQPLSKMASRRCPGHSARSAASVPPFSRFPSWTRTSGFF